MGLPFSLFSVEFPVGIHAESGGTQQDSHSQNARDGGGMDTGGSEHIHVSPHGIIHGIVKIKTRKAWLGIFLSVIGLFENFILIYGMYYIGNRF